MDGHDPADQDQWWYPDDYYPGEAATVPAADAHDNFLDMFANSTEDLFTLVWEGGTAGHGQPAISSVPSPPPQPPPELPRASLEPSPSDDVMAAWLYPIVSGETDQADDSTKIPAKAKSEPEQSTMATVSLGTMTTEDLSGDKNTNRRIDSSERRKAASAGGSSRAARSSHNSGMHNITEKRRRCKFSDRLRTLQQLVPGCDKSNQASTLEQTIQYMKSLQQQVQSMSTAAYPVVPYGAMIPYAYYHAAMMPAAASSALPAMTPAPATYAAPEGQCSISTEQQRKHKRRRIDCDISRQN